MAWRKRKESEIRSQVRYMDEERRSGEIMMRSARCDSVREWERRGAGRVERKKSLIGWEARARSRDSRVPRAFMAATVQCRAT